MRWLEMWAIRPRSLESVAFTKSAAPGPRTSALPRWLTSKRPTLSRPAGHGLAFSTRSLAKLADFLVRGVIEDISHKLSLPRQASHVG